MNRRTFLRSIATVCGAAVVCPGELVKSDPWIKAAALRKKNVAAGEICYGKHGQHCCCNSCVDDVMTDCLPPLIKCEATKCYRYRQQNPCHNCLYNPDDIPTMKLILRKQKDPCCHPLWPELVEVPIDYQGKEWPE